MATGRASGRTPAARGARALSGDEAQLWRRATADVRPLRRAPQPAAIASATARAFAQTQPPPIAPARTANPIRPLVAASAEALVHGRVAGIDKRTLTRLRRGLIAPERQIDLHRQTQGGARRSLDAFLAASQAAGRRCVLVITGKGYGSGGPGVLRTMVPRWLDEQPNHARVLAFCHAVPAHGGDGALYVLLRRTRA